MGFSNDVARLRRELDIPQELTVSVAVHKMAELMGVSVLTEQGANVPLPLLVNEIKKLIIDDSCGGGHGAEAENQEAGELDFVGASLSTEQLKKKQKSAQQRAIGSFFGPTIVKTVRKGQLVNSTITDSASTLGAQFKLLCPDCKKEIAGGHRPALTVHRKFCSAAQEAIAKALAAASARRETVATVGDHDAHIEEVVATSTATSVRFNDGARRAENEQSEPPAAATLEQEEQESAECAAVGKKRRKDGKFKNSGLKEGMHRAPYTLLFKYHVALEFRRNQELKQKGLISSPLEATSEAFNGLPYSNVWKWHQQLEKLAIAVTHETSGCRVQKNKAGKIISFKSRQARRCTLNAGKQSSFAAAEAELLSQFKKERARGLKINERWMKINMKRVVRTHYGEEVANKFKASYGWLQKFCARNNLSLRRSTNNKNESVESRVPRIKRWHARLRRRLKDAAPHKLHPVWGRWLPENRLSVDQVPCNLREGISATYDEKGSNRIWIAGSKQDDGKRFCTLQIVARAANGDVSLPRCGQPKIGVIFRGQGLRISNDEKSQWHPDCHVRFQPKAWADEDYCLAHALNEMKEATAAARGKGQESVAFYDNLHGQTTAEHEKALAKSAISRHLLPTGVTSEIQLIDDGVGYAVKRELGYALDNWLTQPGNLERWTHATFPMWQKRVLITRLLVEAWDKVCHSFDFEQAATRIGMRMTIDGSNDEKIKLQGVQNYSFSDADAGIVSRELNNGVDPDEEDQLSAEIAGQEEDNNDDVSEALRADGGSCTVEGPACDSSDEEDDTDAPHATLANAPDDPPEGFFYVAAPPNMETDEDLKKLVGQWILHAFESSTIQGWFRGRIASKGVSVSEANRIPGANFVVSFDKRITKNDSLHGRVASALLPTNYGPSEWWVLLSKQ